MFDADAFISYTPIGDEPDPGEFLKAHGVNARGISILPIAEQSPEEAARAFTERYLGMRVCVFVPGRAFDRTGTRHGRGGGWYDRFLSRVPREWVRFGVTTETRFTENLIRKEHDEPVDYVLVKGNGWDMMATNARL